jgi:hypothetical protein
VSEKSARKHLDYGVESTAARNRPVFRPRMRRGSCKILRSGAIQANRCEKGDSGLWASGACRVVIRNARYLGHSSKMTDETRSLP